MRKMARGNLVTLLAEVVNINYDLKVVSLAEKGKAKNNAVEKDLENKENEEKMTNTMVLNFLVKCFDEDDQRYYTLPVAVWGKKEVKQCQEFLNNGDLVYIQGELRYKFIYNKTNKKFERVYTTVKADTVEFLTKKLKNTKNIESKKLEHYINDVKLIGNLVEDPTDTKKGFVVAVDRKYPTKDVKTPNHKLTDYVTLVLDGDAKVKGNLKKGSVVVVNGKLMTRRIEELEQEATPRIVVGVKEIVGR